MKANGLTLCVASCLFWLMANGVALADRPIRIGINSQQYGPSRARVGTRIDASSARAGRSHSRADTAASPQGLVVKVTTPHRASRLASWFPPLASNSPVLRDKHPGGPGGYWYTDAAGHKCLYTPASVAQCFTVVPAKGAAQGLSPALVAESLAREAGLAPGEINASPTNAGLTGAQSWFWLDPAPHRESLSISLAGETVNVIADPTVEWRFGDGASLDAGPGVPYQADAVPAGAITHVYGTRCLPGDQGHDPYVLASCGQDGYSIAALVVWRITYNAAGPIAASGTLPARTTETSTAYPVSESRAFLVSGGGR